MQIAPSSQTDPVKSMGQNEEQLCRHQRIPIGVMGLGRGHSQPCGAGHQALGIRGLDSRDPIEMGDQISHVDDPQSPGSAGIAVDGAKKGSFHPGCPGQDLASRDGLVETGFEVFAGSASP